MEIGKKREDKIGIKILKWKIGLEVEDERDKGASFVHGRIY